MKFAIDGSALSGKKTGIDFTTDGIISGFKAYPRQELLVYVTQHFVRKGGNSLAPNIKFVVIDKQPGFASGLKWYRKATRDMKAKKVDVFISTFTFAASLMFKHTIQIVYDLSPIDFPRMFGWKSSLVYRLMLAWAMKKAWKVVTISHAVADEMMKRYKRPVGVIPLSINEWAKEERASGPADQRTLKKYKLPEKYFLSISTIQPRKNYENMIRGFAKFLTQHPDYSYVIVGKQGWKYEKVFETVEELNLKRQVIFLDYLPDEDLLPILDNAAGFMYVSLDEGFGIPPLNAVYRGIPTLVSDLPVFRETLSGTNSVYADPKDPRDIAEGLEQVIKIKRSDNKDTILEKYNWQLTAKTLIQLGTGIKLK
jgi:glycosyltransferase involved in cell wall biosynthesis